MKSCQLQRGSRFKINGKEGEAINGQEELEEITKEKHLGDKLIPALSNQKKIEEKQQDEE